LVKVQEDYPDNAELSTKIREQKKALMKMWSEIYKQKKSVSTPALSRMSSEVPEKPVEPSK